MFCFVDMNKLFLGVIKCFVVLLMLNVSGVVSAQWRPDSLGCGFEMRFVEQGEDYSGRVRSTVVRHRAEGESHRGVLYIHGYNDYFFQSELGLRFAGQGYNFYAVDLRKYGRSLVAGQKPFQVRRFEEYFADIDSALAVMRNDGCSEIVLIGHSTGGLAAAYYLAHNADAPVDALMLNSPFLDWNLGGVERFVGAVSAMGKVFPNIPVSTGGGGVYEQAISSEAYGEWNYNHAWKSTNYGVDLGWVRAVNNAQVYLREHRNSIKVPILLLYSARSSNPDVWSEEAMRTDVVLDVNDIRRYGVMLGENVTSAKVEGGMHDLFLSERRLREKLYDYVFWWLDEKLHR